MGKLFVAAFAVIALVLSGCVGNELNQGVSNNPPEDFSTATQYQNTALGGAFKENDKVDFFGVKGTIVTGQIENGKITSDYLQINGDTSPLLVYASANDPVYGKVGIAHYPQRGGGEGEADLYIGSELIATLKYSKDYSFNGYVTIACEPDRYPEFTGTVLIKKHRDCP